MKNIIYILLAISVFSCQLPEQPEKKATVTPKKNIIILLDLSDRLIVQAEQPARDKEIIKSIYKIFEEKVKHDLYIRSRDEIKVVIAPQRGANLPTYKYEDMLYINMDNIPRISRNPKEQERRETFHGYIDTLYQESVYSSNPKKYFGADIWKYIYEDLEHDMSSDTLTDNYLFILTDGYPVVGKDTAKLEPVNKTFPELEVVLVEVAPRDKDLEMDRIMELWQEWLEEMDVKDYTFIKRKAITKEMDQIKEILGAA